MSRKFLLPIRRVVLASHELAARLVSRRRSPAGSVLDTIVVYCFLDQAAPQLLVQAVVSYVGGYAP